MEPERLYFRFEKRFVSLSYLREHAAPTPQTNRNRTLYNFRVNTVDTM